jgi:hypothetical protein
VANGVLFHRLGDVEERSDGHRESRSREESKGDLEDGGEQVERIEVSKDAPGRGEDDGREESKEKPNVCEPTTMHVAREHQCQADQTSDDRE